MIEQSWNWTEGRRNFCRSVQEHKNGNHFITEEREESEKTLYYLFRLKKMKFWTKELFLSVLVDTDNTERVN